MKHTRLEDRYELGKVLGRGGMGVVYQAHDLLLDRDVALKTILDIDNEVALNLFYRECSVQSKIVHPNIIEVFDMGEFIDTDGATKPFYVMPLLPGETLRSLIDSGSPRLTLERSINIFRGACRGLQAAHDNGLVHRDLKPGNLIILPDDSVKLIDFGIAHIIDTGVKTMLKGTLHYMAPEQLDLKQPTAMSDVYSLGVVCYETLTRRLPFAGLEQSDLSEAIRTQTPPTAAEVNPSIPEAVSQVLHKAMAKQPWHRFATAQIFGDTLVRALVEGEVELYDQEEVGQRLERAQKAFEEGDYDFANEVVRDLEGQGVVTPEVRSLRRRVVQTIRHQRVDKLLSAARRFTSEGEHPVALRKIQDALELDPQNTDALALQAEVEKERQGKQIDNWVRLAREHLANNAFDRAREAVENVLQLNSENADAHEVRAAIERTEQEAQRMRMRKEELYRTASDAWGRGEVTHAITRLESLISLEKEKPETDGSRSAAYRNLYQEVRSEQQAIESANQRARAAIAADRVEEAEAIVQEFGARYPANVLFQSLKVDVEQRRRQRLSEAIAETDRALEAEPDLKKRVGMLEKTLERFPGEEHFERALKLARDKSELVESIIRKGRYFEDQNQFAEALGQWRMLESIHREHPGLTLEIERTEKRRDEQTTAESKERWSSEIEANLNAGDPQRAIENCDRALAEFPEDSDLGELRKVAEKRVARAAQARELFEKAKTSLEEGRRAEAIDQLREVGRMDSANIAAKTVLLNALVEAADQAAEEDWQAAAPLVDEIAQQDPGHAALEGLRRKLEHAKREQFLSGFLDRVRELQAAGNLDEAVETLERAAALYPGEPRLERLAATIRHSQEAQEVDEVDKVEAVEAPAEEEAIVAAAPPATEQTPERAEEPTVISMPAAIAGQDAPTELGPAVGGPEKPPPTAPPPPTPPPVAANNGLPRHFMKLVAAAVAAGVLVAIAIWMWGGARKPAPAPVVVAAPNFFIDVLPANARILVDDIECGLGSCEATLKPGQRVIRAQLPGYRAELATVMVAEDGTVAPGNLTLTLDALPTTLVLSTNRPNGVVRLDGEQAGTFVSGELEIESLPAGEHEIEIRDGATSATLRFLAAPGRAPQILAVSAVNLRVAAASVLSGEAQVFSDRLDEPIAVDGAAIDSVTAEAGSPITNLTDGFHEVSIGSEEDHVALAFEAGAQPRLAASFSADLPTGILYVIAGVDDATVLLNGRPYTRRKTNRGRLRLDPMPGTLRIGVRKEGFVTPPEVEVRIRKGAVARAEFTLEPEAARAALRLTGGSPGAAVSIDGQNAGQISNDGTLEIAGLAAGRRQVRIARGATESKTLTVDLSAGETFQADAAFERVTGLLRVELSPPSPEASVTYRRAGATASAALSAAGVRVAPGAYVVRATAPGRTATEAEVEVSANGEGVARLRLEEEATAPAVKNVDYLSALASMDGWVGRVEGAVRRGGGFVYGPVKPEAGIYRFKVRRQSSGSIQWFFVFADGEPYWIYEVSRRHVERFQIASDERQRESNYDSGAGRDEEVTVEIRVQAASIVTTVTVDGKVIAQDRLEQAGARFDQGRWGFMMDRGDQLAVSSLQFEATQ